jgi:hypothetical protein
MAIGSIGAGSAASGAAMQSAINSFAAHAASGDAAGKANDVKNIIDLAKNAKTNDPAKEQAAPKPPAGGGGAPSSGGGEDDPIKKRAKELEKQGVPPQLAMKMAEMEAKAGQSAGGSTCGSQGCPS